MFKQYGKLLTLATLAYSSLTFSATPALTQSDIAKTTPAKSCAFNDIDYDVATAFVIKLQQTVKANDSTSLAKMTKYPLRINVTSNNAKTKSYSIKNKTDFLRQYSKIFDKKLSAAILQANPKDIFCNYQGAMISDGALWFTTANHSGYIFAINTQ